MKRLGLEEPPFKYPRTYHLLDASVGTGGSRGSAVTRDDLLLSKDELKKFIGGNTVIIEEKIDGSNIGISLGPSYVFRVQNRSHFVNAKTATQFKKLDDFLSNNAAGLHKVLGGTPGGRTLF